LRKTYGVILPDRLMPVKVRKRTSCDRSAPVVPDVHEREKVRIPKNREAGFGPAYNRWRETFSLSGSLSSPQQSIADWLYCTDRALCVNTRLLAKSSAIIFRQFRKVFTRFERE
jgi:hypothetical protein